MSERIRGSYDDVLYKSTYICFTLLYYIMDSHMDSKAVLNVVNSIRSSVLFGSNDWLAMSQNQSCFGWVTHSGCPQLN